MAKSASKQLKTLTFVGLVAALVFVGGAQLAAWGASFADGTVHDQLVQEKVFFPKAGTPALDPKEFPGLQQYAGQQVDNGPKAKAYANEFIWAHMMKSSGGKTYAEVSTAAMANPKDAKLAALKTSLFQGDMLRSSLLTAYAFSVFGAIANYATLALYGLAVLALVFALWPFFLKRR